MKLQSLKKNNNKKEGGGILDYRDEEVNIKFSGLIDCFLFLFFLYKYIKIYILYFLKFIFDINKFKTIKKNWQRRREASIEFLGQQCLLIIFFKVIFLKYIKKIFFYFLKFILNINTSFKNTKILI